VSTVTAGFSRLKTESLSSLQTESKQRAASVVFTTRLSPKTTASLALRRVRFDNTALTSYLENALAGSILMRF
jgi:hypothetical protein